MVLRIISTWAHLSKNKVPFRYSTNLWWFRERHWNPRRILTHDRPARTNFGEDAFILCLAVFPKMKPWGTPKNIPNPWSKKQRKEDTKLLWICSSVRARLFSLNYERIDVISLDCIISKESSSISWWWFRGRVTEN